MSQHVLSIGYSLDVALDTDWKLDDVARLIVGKRPGSSGGMPVEGGERDLQFYFDTDRELQVAKARVEMDGRFRIRNTYVRS